ncbi:MAG TPA: hypothetical protein VKH37_02345 [Ferruginibacter sp.]|nr:hypothetical protein [Ferruginibacter sp.]
MMNGERKSPQIEVSRSASGELKSVTELLNTYKGDIQEFQNEPLPKPVN